MPCESELVAAPATPLAAATALGHLPADLPVTQIALFSSGVGFFQHAGTVEGVATTTLRFTKDQLNDVLKSLVVSDLDGGRVDQVGYPSSDPLGRALRGFAVDLSDAPSLAELIGALRGAEVVVAAGGREIAGRILGVETRPTPAGEVVFERTVVTLLAAGGVHGIDLDSALSIRLADPALAGELERALAVVAAARDAEKKDITLHFSGEGRRRVRAGYVVATPLWKTSYRLVLGDPGAQLQGWAIVENQTDADWREVTLALVSGRPNSFQMDLYEPQYLERPTAQLAGFAELKPQSHAEAAPLREGRRMAKMASVGRAAPAMMSAALADESFSVETLGMGAGVESAASGERVGELFEYRIPAVSLDRQSSALIPIITEPITATKLSIYNRATLARHPLSGAKLHNTTAKHLLAGPVTVFDGAGYAGDAQIESIPPGQERLISYGVDLEVVVDLPARNLPSWEETLSFVRGALETVRSETVTQTYVLTSKANADKQVIVEHERMIGWELVAGHDPSETTDRLLRFTMLLPAGATKELTVAQKLVTSHAVSLLDYQLPMIAAHLSTSRMSPEVAHALGEVVTLRQSEAQAQRRLDETRSELATAKAEQTRLLEGLAGVDKATPYADRMLAKLDAEETHIEGLQRSVSELTATVQECRSALEDYLRDLDLA
ncbi:MAG: hypothetical protein ACOYEV_12440 [Candidatus Nanopelagicales bacterium]